MCNWNYFVNFVREKYPNEDIIPLHRPLFCGNEKKYLIDCIDSTYVSYIGKYVDKLEQMLCDYTGSKFAVATTNGTAALYMALYALDVKDNCEVITQPLTFVATCNAIKYCNAKPVFIDVELETLGLSPEKLDKFLQSNTEIRNGLCINKLTGNTIKACVPMHTFGHPCKIDEIKEICDNNKILLIEDSAESLGSMYKNKHTGTFGNAGIYSFNGNKTITCGGGGAIVTDDEQLARHLKHLTTTAKINHIYEYNHDETGFNFRLPNINAALAVAQLENIDSFINSKRELAAQYYKLFKDHSIQFFTEPENAYSNYWLNTIILQNKQQRDQFLETTNKSGIMTRPAWKLMNKLNMFKDCICGEIKNAEFLEDRIANLPGSVTK